MSKARLLVRAYLLGLVAVAIAVAPLNVASAGDQSGRVDYRSGGQARGLSSGRGHDGRRGHGNDRHRRSGNASLRVQGNRSYEGLGGPQYESGRSNYRDHEDSHRTRYDTRHYDPPRHSRDRGYRDYGRHYERRPDYYRDHYRHYYRPPRHYHHPIYVGGLPYYYYSGYFYRPHRDSYWIRVVAPIGARIGTLPAGYISFGYGSSTYYYLNATWFLYDRPAREYVVVEPPPGVVSASYAGSADYAAAHDSDEIFVYPARGQSTEQTQRDRYECDLWAVSQTGIDPSMGQADDRERAEYRRALTACLEGRGYTVR